MKQEKIGEDSPEDPGLTDDYIVVDYVPNPNNNNNVIVINNPIQENRLTLPQALVLGLVGVHLCSESSFGLVALIFIFF